MARRASSPEERFTEPFLPMRWFDEPDETSTLDQSEESDHDVPVVLLKEDLRDLIFRDERHSGGGLDDSPHTPMRRMTQRPIELSRRGKRDMRDDPGFPSPLSLFRHSTFRNNEKSIKPQLQRRREKNLVDEYKESQQMNDPRRRRVMTRGSSSPRMGQRRLSHPVGIYRDLETLPHVGTPTHPRSRINSERIPGRD